jgi:hypothetical protein
MKMSFGRKGKMNKKMNSKMSMVSESGDIRSPSASG